MKRPYKLKVLKNEIEVSANHITELFSKHEVYVFGYGSLLHSGGWALRFMTKPPAKEDLLECTLNNFVRGPWGLFTTYLKFPSKAYYGIIRNACSETNGVIAKIHNKYDWVNLMTSEAVAGIGMYYNYRVVDVTEDIDKSSLLLPANAVIHAVVNEPINKVRSPFSMTPYKYYDAVWAGIQKERSSEFVKRFLELGGFKNNEEVEALFLKQRMEMANKTSK